MNNVDKGPLFPGVISQVERQKANGTWQPWYGAHWRGEDRVFTSYAAAERWLLAQKERNWT